MAKSEVDLDMALVRLADEASPRPSPGLVGRVLADAALTSLAREARAASPRLTDGLAARVLADAALTTLAREASRQPGARLVERVLADAASVAATTRPAEPAPVRPRAGWRRRAASALAFGWAGGALASLVLALAIGIGIGVRMEPGTLPILDDRAGESSDVLALAVLDGDFMSADGL